MPIACWTIFGREGDTACKAVPRMGTPPARQCHGWGRRLQGSATDESTACKAVPRKFVYAATGDALQGIACCAVVEHSGSSVRITNV